jgi:hypothetical protein
MMKVSTTKLGRGLGLALLIMANIVYAQEEVITIQSAQGKQFIIPKSLINAHALLAWFNENNYTLQDIKGFLPYNLELQIIKEEQAKREALAHKMRQEKKDAELKQEMINHYLQTGIKPEALIQRQDIGCSISQLINHNLLKHSSSRRAIKLQNNIIKINMLSMTNQMINSIEGLDTFDLTKYTYIDLSDNRIDSLCFETLQKIHDQLYFPLTIELHRNPFKMTAKIKEQLASLPMISILV